MLTVCNVGVPQTTDIDCVVVGLLDHLIDFREPLDRRHLVGGNKSRCVDVAETCGKSQLLSRGQCLVWKKNDLIVEESLMDKVKLTFCEGRGEINTFDLRP